MFSRTSRLSETPPVGPSGVFATVEMVVLVVGVMEAEGELVEGFGTLDAAAVMETSCGCDVLLTCSSVGEVVFVTEMVLFMLTSVGS